MTVSDTDFDQTNKATATTTATGRRLSPGLRVGQPVTRHLAIFNDDLFGSDLVIDWSLHDGTADGARLAGGTIPLSVPPGEFATRDITFTAPDAPGTVVLAVSSTKNGAVQFQGTGWPFASSQRRTR